MDSRTAATAVFVTLLLAMTARIPVAAQQIRQRNATNWMIEETGLHSIPVSGFQRLLRRPVESVAEEQEQTLRVVPVHSNATDIAVTIQFFCTQSYQQKACLEDIHTLREALGPYPLSRLGAWSFVVVPAAEWESLVRSLGHDPITPAFTILDQHVTVLDGSLFSGNAVRKKELLLTYGANGIEMLTRAIVHELGHGICREKDERRTESYGEELRRTRSTACALGDRRESKQASR